MSTKVITPLILSVLFLASCDPARILVIKASGKANSSVTIYTTRAFAPTINNEDHTGLIISLPVKDTAKKIFYYGMGGWSDNSLKNLSMRIDSIIINNCTHQLVLMHKPDIENYLKKHRGGLFGSVLTIKAK